jgi:hypothetical protein
VNDVTLSHDPFLPHAVQITVHQPSEHSTLCSPHCSQRRKMNQKQANEQICYELSETRSMPTFTQSKQLLLVNKFLFVCDTSNIFRVCTKTIIIKSATIKVTLYHISFQFGSEVSRRVKVYRMSLLLLLLLLLLFVSCEMLLQN